MAFQKKPLRGPDNIPPHRQHVDYIYVAYSDSVLTRRNTAQSHGIINRFRTKSYEMKG